MSENPEQDIHSRLILEHLNETFFNQEICTKFILTILHPQGPVCPSCGAAIDSEKQISR